MKKLLGIVVFVIVGIACSCSNASVTDVSTEGWEDCGDVNIAVIPPTLEPDKSSTIHRVEYRVTGTAGTKSARMSYKNESGEVEQQTSELPWSQVYLMPYGQSLCISANANVDDLTCEIFLDGEWYNTAMGLGSVFCIGAVE